jgi:serine/threonine protein kinase
MDNIGEYRIIRLLGEGGMGKVFEAEERLSGRRVALKLLRPELARSEPGRRLFANEMTILSGLDHPNVVRCLSCAEVNGELMMALELLEGRTLRELLETEGTIAWPRAVSFVQQMARALLAAHEHVPSIVHRDLKPENVMVLEDGSLKVMDFGVAKMRLALGNATTHSVGTLSYMSPEQIDAGPVDGRSDLYALGLVFYELLGGRPPFASSSPRELLNLQCTVAPPPLPNNVRHDLPSGVERLLFELLEKQPSSRPGSAADVLAALDPFVPSSVSEGSRPRSARSGKVVGPAAAISAGAPAAAAVSLTGSLGNERTLRSTPAPTETVRGVREDTVLMLERATAPRDIGWKQGLMVIAALSALAGLLTYAVKAPGDADLRESGAIPSNGALSRSGP